MRYGLDPRQLLAEIIEPARARLAFSTDVQARNALVLGTAMAESELRFLKQRGGGPALGLWQCEPATLQSIDSDFLMFRGPLRSIVANGAPIYTARLKYDLFFAATICHVHYRRVSEVLPPMDADAMAHYWKQHYNTPEGLGVAREKRVHFQNAIEVIYGG